MRRVGFSSVIAMALIAIAGCVELAPPASSTGVGEIETERTVHELTFVPSARAAGTTSTRSCVDLLFEDPGAFELIEFYATLAIPDPSLRPTSGNMILASAGILNETRERLPDGRYYLTVPGTAEVKWLFSVCYYADDDEGPQATLDVTGTGELLIHRRGASS